MQLAPSEGAESPRTPPLWSQSERTSPSSPLKMPGSPLISPSGKNTGSGSSTPGAWFQNNKLLSKLPLCLRAKPIKVMVLGLSGVGKSALTVRFITRRFIGDYDPTLEDIYTHETIVNNEFVSFQILDSGGHTRDTEQVYLESNIRWADAFILMYSVTDKCSFDECIRLKFFINLMNKRRRLMSAPILRELFDVPVILVGNKVDQYGDRMIDTADGLRRSRETACAGFHEISVRESVEDVVRVFQDVYSKWKTWSRSCKIRRHSDDVRPAFVKASSAPQVRACSIKFHAHRVISDGSLQYQNSLPESSAVVDSPEAIFRDRACTDGTLAAFVQWQSRKTGFRLGTTASSPLWFRRMSISMRGSISS